MPEDGERWFVGRTLPRKERLAQEQLERQGFHVFLPAIMSARRHARKVERVKAPLFPRYLFIRMDLQRDRWRSVNGTKGMVCVLTNHDLPCPITDGFVEDLQAAVGADGCVGAGLTLRPGDQVRIFSGSFRGQIGELLRLEGRERVEVLLSFLGSAVRVKMSRSLLDLAV